MNLPKIITNILISIGMMIIFTYFFYFYIILKIEKKDFYNLLNNQFIKNNLDIKFQNSNEISKNIKTNNQLNQKALNLVVYIAMPAIFIAIILIIYFQLKIKKILLTNIIILITTIIAEVIFAFVFTKRFTLIDDTSFKIMILDSVGTYLSWFTSAYNLCPNTTPQMN